MKTLGVQLPVADDLVMLAVIGGVMVLGGSLVMKLLRRF